MVFLQLVYSKTSDTFRHWHTNRRLSSHIPLSLTGNLSITEMNVWRHLGLSGLKKAERNNLAFLADPFGDWSKNRKKGRKRKTKQGKSPEFHFQLNCNSRGTRGICSSPGFKCTGGRGFHEKKINNWFQQNIWSTTISRSFLFSGLLFLTSCAVLRTWTPVFCFPVNLVSGHLNILRCKEAVRKPWVVST